MADQRFGPDGDFSYEAMVQRYNADLANNFGNLANRVLNMAMNYCGGVVPEPTAPTGRSSTRPRPRSTGCRAAMARLDFASGFGAVWDLIRAANAYIEDQQPWALNKAGDAVAVAEVLGDCLEALRIVALLASPVIPERGRRAVAPARSAGAARARSGCPTRRAWGQLRPGAQLEKGDAAVPAQEMWSDHAWCAWVDSHCHVHSAAGADEHVARAQAAGVEWMVCVGTDLATSQEALDLAARHADVYATVGLHPHDASKLAAEWEMLEAARGRPTSASASAKPGSTSTTSTRRATSRRRRSGGRSASRSGSASRS